MSRGRNIRRGYGIRGYVGANGHGKSLAMVHDILPSLDACRPVLSNVRLLDWRNPRPCDDPECVSEDHHRHLAAHPSYVPLTDFAQLLEWRSGDVLLDEVTGVASSRESAALPVQVVNLLVQLRRRDVTLSWTAPSWARADKVIREVSQIVVECRGMMPKARPTEDGSAMWKDKRLFWWRAYDATAFQDWTDGKREKAVRVASEWHWRPRHEAHSAYDTYDTVSALGWAMESGLCLACGGKRSVPRCTCQPGQGAPGAGPRRTSPRLTREERAAIRDGVAIPVPVYAGTGSAEKSPALGQEPGEWPGPSEEVTTWQA